MNTPLIKHLEDSNFNNIPCKLSDFKQVLQKKLLASIIIISEIPNITIMTKVMQV